MKKIDKNKLESGKIDSQKPSYSSGLLRGPHGVNNFSLLYILQKNYINKTL